MNKTKAQRNLWWKESRGATDYDLWSDTVVVSLQNGMNAPHIATRLGTERVVPAFLSFPADWQAPGHIEPSKAARETSGSEKWMAG